MTASDNDHTAFFQPPPAADPGDRAEPAPPQRLGKYLLGEPIGTGSLGTVYRTTDPDTKRDLVIRVIPLSQLQAAGAPFLAQYRAGIQKALALSHPGIVPIRLYGEEAGFAYVTTDYVKGRSLETRFEAKTHSSLEQVIDIQSQLLQALQYVHDRGQCHGTLTPANVLITTNGRVRIKNVGFLHPGGSTGTPGYTAPEQQDGGASDQLGDVYATGAIFYALLTGAPPVGDGQPLPPSQEARQASLRPFDELALHALSRDPAGRLPSVAKFFESLLEAYVYGGDDEGASDRTLASQTPQASPADLTRLLNEAPVAEPEAARAEAAALVEFVVPVSPDPTTMVSAPPSQIASPPLLPPPPFVEAAPTRLLNFSPPSEPERSPVAEPSPRTVTATPAAASSPAATSPAAAVGNADAEVTRIEKRLMQIMGPIAVIMVRRGARETSDTASLIQWLALRIDSSSEREKFVADLTLMSLAPAPAAAPDAPATAATDDRTRLYYVMDAPGKRAVSSDDIARASQWLTTHLGPIALVLARRTAQQPGCTREQFAAILASHLPNERERERFIEAFR